MPDEIVLYRSLASRSFTVLWMLEELGVPYRERMVDIRSGAQKSPDYLALNPMGKVPAMTVNGAVVTEAAAICLFLADRYSLGTLAPQPDDIERGPYLRWSLFAASVVEPAITLKGQGIEPPARRVGWGAYDDVVRTLAGALEGRAFIVGDRFTAADVILGSAVSFGLFNNMLPEEPALVAYNALMGARPAQQKAMALTWPPEVMAQANP